MDKHLPKALLSKAAFIVDISRPRSTQIPLGVFLEVVWPAKGRWFGLVGRQKLQESELSTLSRLDFPELKQPWEFLSKQFDLAWEQPAGKSCLWLSTEHRWSLNFSPPIEHDLSEILLQHSDFSLLDMEKSLNSYLPQLEEYLDSPSMPLSGQVISFKPKQLSGVVRTASARVPLAA